MSESKTTTDHKSIQKWAEARKGVPSKISNTGSKKGDGVLRIHFPDNSDKEENFDEISWDEFFKIFDKNKLAFLYQEKKMSGEGSTFHKFVNRDE